MNKFFAVLFSVFIIISNLAFAAKPPTCGFNKQCPDGLACVGATGTATNGTCVLTGPQIALCKSVLYFDDKLVSIFAIFAIVMIGIAFFLGKISWGMIVSVILGIAIAKGAVSIIKKVSGQDEGYCTSEIVSYSFLVGKDSNGESCVEDVNKIANTPYIYNTTNKGMGGLCADPVSCFKHTCTVPASLSSVGALYIIFNSKYLGVSASKNSQDKVEVFLPSAAMQLTNARSAAEFASGVDASNNPIITANATCTPVSASPNQDYFACVNSCINVKFGHVYNVGKYADCKAIVAAQ